MARMDMAERRRPQDGRIMAVIKHEKIEFRASTLPVGTGEKLVLRVLKTKWARQSFEKLGMVKKDRDLVEKIVHRPNGLILVTGPTGSGKSTSLYNMLLQVADGEKNITSIEDPIEYLFDEFNQVAVQSRLGMDFPEVIKACLRQDPDILMIGEIRDKVTASMAITASLTGHLVFSTLHTNSAIAAISRLRDLDQENFLIADTLLAVISQRLVRKVCQFCKDWKAPDKKERAVLEGFNLEMEKIAFGLGCEKCRKTGYFGRIGLFEIIPMDQDLLELVSLNESIETIEKIARKKFSKDLLKDGLSKIKSGETTISEVLNKVFDSKNFS